MKVWLVWTGEYSDACVVGVYSSLELAQAAAKLYGPQFKEGRVQEAAFEIDADAVMVRAGVARWRVDVDVIDGSMPWIYSQGPGTGAPVDIGLTKSYEPDNNRLRLVIDCDARDQDHAVKIAGDERAQYLATHPQVLVDAQTLIDAERAKPKPVKHPSHFPISTSGF